MELQKVYLVGSLRNRRIPEIANELREAGYDVFDDWFAGGYEADDQWQLYEHQRGHNYRDALYGYHATDVFQFDLTHLKRADIVVMVMPCGKSGHLELGWFIGTGRPGFILFDKDPERYDIMYRFATDIAFSVEELLRRMKPYA